MRQHAIDILPEALRMRSQAGQRTGRFAAAAVGAVVLLIVLATHSRVVLRGAQERRMMASAQAQQAQNVQARAEQLQQALTRSKNFVDIYSRVALPLDVSAVIATLINELPEGMTLDQLDIDCGTRAISRSPRTRGADGKDEARPRVLSGELSGFALNDQQVAELVARLDMRPPFRSVSLDFSRTRSVRGQGAREFRLSFRIDLDTPYEVNVVSASPRDAASDQPRGMP